jgi:hypothetical protein
LQSFWPIDIIPIVKKGVSELKRTVGMLLVVIFCVAFIGSVAYAGAMVPRQDTSPPAPEEEVAPPPPPPPPPAKAEEKKSGCCLWPF